MGIVNAVIGALRVNLGLDSAEFENGIKRNQEGLKGLLVGFTVDIGALADKVGEAFKAIPEAIKGTIDKAADLGHLSEKIGIPVEALSELELAAEGADVSIDSLTTGIKTLDDNMLLTATTGKGKAANAFAALGISVNDTNGHLKSASEVFSEIATKFAGMDDGATKTALSNAILGKSAQDLIPLLDKGGTYLKETAQSARDFGNATSGETAASAIDFNDHLETMQNRVDGLGNRIVTGLLPSLDYIVGGFDNATSSAGGWNAIAEDVVGGIKNLESAAIVTGAAFAASVAAEAEFFDVLNTAAHGDFGHIGDVIAGDNQKLANLVANTQSTLSGLWESFDGAGAHPTDVEDWADKNRKELEEWAAQAKALADEKAQAAAADDKAFASDMTKAQGRVSALQQQTAAQAALNPLVTDYGASVAEAGLAAQLENSATEHHIQMTPALLAAIGAEAKQWGEATAASNELAQAQQLTVQRTDDLRNASKDVLGGLIDDLEQGKSLLQDLGDIAMTVGKDLISSGLDQLFNNKSQGGSGVLDSVFSGIASMLHFADGGSGTVGGAGGRDSQLFTAMVTPGEPFAFGQDALNGIGGGTGTTINLNSTVNANGGGVSKSQIQAMVNEQFGQLKRALPAILADSRRRGAT